MARFPPFYSDAPTSEHEKKGGTGRLSSYPVSQEKASTLPLNLLLGFLFEHVAHAVQ